ncbi:Copper chaperone [Mycena indigotica]|uniref:Copper chaperone n=1 Tax=Mycena indigotica TaxID=2126181 RepID=A0A8H6S8R0_9AGAR|nr:Copper chaperone [Mycena indigotica]KAF7294913.1 Copper chaperone [Mycena indigotica]
MSSFYAGRTHLQVRRQGSLEAVVIPGFPHPRLQMTCSGCSGAVTRVLEKAKTDGVSEYTVNLETQEVLVKGTIPYEDVLARIKKTGKEVSDLS